jgi:CheY-like chemotaxis protein
MKQTLEILIVEDTPSHRQDAMDAAAHYSHIQFSYAATQEEAEKLLAEKQFDAVVMDVFFPRDERSLPLSATAVADTAMELRTILEDRGIPYVHNTDGNHHGRNLLEFCIFTGLRAYQNTDEKILFDPEDFTAGVFFAQTRYLIYDFRNFSMIHSELGTRTRYSGFVSGKVIETYPDQINAHGKNKQWAAAINYVILLAHASEMSNEERESVQQHLNFSPDGDRGTLTRKMEELMAGEEDIGVICMKRILSKYKPQ